MKINQLFSNDLAMWIQFKLNLGDFKSLIDLIYDLDQ